jgi:hypothetical protein
VVIARKVQNTTIDQGVSGSATWALQLLDDCLATGPTLPYPQLVLGIAPLGTLRGYWRLGDLAAPFLDSSGWSGGPTPLTLAGAGAAPTFHIAGALPAAEDDGAVGVNGGAGTGQYLHNAAAAINQGINSAWSIAAWVKPTSTAAAWIAGVYNNLASPAGVDNGWQMTVRYTGTGAIAGLRRAIVGAYIAIGVAIPFDTWTFLVGTYDAATLRLYANGALSASFADARADTFNPYSNPDVGVLFVDPLFAVGRFLGGLDEIAVWGTTLSAADVADLYTAGLP